MSLKKKKIRITIIFRNEHIILMNSNIKLFHPIQLLLYFFVAHVLLNLFLPFDYYFLIVSKKKNTRKNDILHIKIIVNFIKIAI